MATDVKSGGTAVIKWRFVRDDGTTGKVDGDLNFSLPVAEAPTLGEDGFYTAKFKGGTGLTTVTVSADVDLSPDVKDVKDFPLAELNWLAEGQTANVSDISVSVE